MRPSLLLPFLAAALLAVPPAAGYPISAVPLWDLTTTATTIVVAKVRAVEMAPEQDGRHDSHIARLDVIETWKGDDVPSLDVPFPGNLICPAPPMYAEGDVAVAFLEPEEDGLLHRRPLLRHSLRPRRDLDDLSESVRSALAIQATESSIKK